MPYQSLIKAWLMEDIDQDRSTDRLGFEYEHEAKAFLRVAGYALLRRGLTPLILCQLVLAHSAVGRSEKHRNLRMTVPRCPVSVSTAAV